MKESGHRFLLRLGIASFAGAFVVSPALAARDIFVEVPGIPGEVTTTGFTGTISAESLALGYSVPVDPATGIASGKLNFAPVVITKRADTTTPVLMAAGGKGTVFPTLVLKSTTTTQDATVLVNQTVTLSNARVTEWRLVDAKNATNAAATEQVAFAASGITVESVRVDGATNVPQKPVTGQVGSVK